MGLNQDQVEMPHKFFIKPIATRDGEKVTTLSPMTF